MTELMDGDEHDLAEAKAGRPDAFARLYDRHAPIVFALCRRRSAPDAEDAAQETFIRAFRKLDQLDDPARFRPWLYAIAANVCAEKRRAAVRRTHHEGRAMTMNGWLKREATQAAPPHERSEEFEQLTAAMESLTDQERLALHLHYLERDPVRAALPALGVSRSGYYKLLDRARTKLAAMLNVSTEPAPEPPESRQTEANP